VNRSLLDTVEPGQAPPQPLANLRHSQRVKSAGVTLCHTDTRLPDDDLAT
jgi:hypothetical protein